MEKADSSVVPGQFLGYSFQVSRMLEHLLRAEAGSSVSLEVLGDTAIHGTAGDAVVEEAKSSISGANPVANRSIQLWKTFRNWRRLVAGGTEDLCEFRLHVLQAHTGSIVKSFSDAKDADSACKVVLAAKETLDEEPPSSGTDLHDCLKQVYADPIDELVKIVERFKFSHGTGRAFDALVSALDATSIPPEVAEPVLRGALGWVKVRVDECIEIGEPAVLTCVDFWKEVRALVRKFDREHILASVAPAPSEARIVEEIGTQTYIRQLELIEEDYEGLIRAANHYLRARADRTLWAQSSRVHASSFDELEADLGAAWANIRNRISIRDSQTTDIERGMLLYLDCQEHDCAVQGMIPPSHFITGCFHGLSDQKAIGWHPKYEELLEENE